MTKDYFFGVSERGTRYVGCFCVCVWGSILNKYFQWKNYQNAWNTIPKAGIYRGVIWNNNYMQLLITPVWAFFDRYYPYQESTILLFQSVLVASKTVLDDGSTTEDLALAYANRSAAHFYMHEYKVIVMYKTNKQKNKQTNTCTSKQAHLHTNKSYIVGISMCLYVVRVCIICTYKHTHNVILVRTNKQQTCKQIDRETSFHQKSFICKLCSWGPVQPQDQEDIL